MSFYVRVGDVPPKRHTFYAGADGQRLAEELMGEEGFRGASSLLYHRHSPSAITGVEAASVPASPLSDNDPLLPWHFRAGQLPAGGDLVTGRQVLMGNADVRICWAKAEASSELYRNAAGDELVYIQSGAVRMESVFGALEVSAGDYLVIPASTTHRWVVGSNTGSVEALVLEAAGHVSIPERYLTATGQLREGAPYSERDLRPPAGPLVSDHEGQVPVLVRTRQGWSRHCHARHPFDVVGWDGCVYPYALSIRDFEPVVGRIHQPPPVHQTFAGRGFVVCSFVPRLFDFDPAAIKVPYHHANVDSDEVLFYSDGDFMSRKGSGIGRASISLHPAGFVHGPQPGSVEASMSADRTDETAVMIDTFAPLQISEAARSVADPDYPYSWAR
ncbi:MAG TPA: homogentisate 1,2-dioxygenase [Acidimicrobiales bacterium]|nr:homogentisate 1,2-dioxygenase [Acidimicrobiales bacterium]